MKKQTKILIIALILLIVLGGYILNDKIIKPYYQQQGEINLAVRMNNQNFFPVICGEEIVNIQPKYNREEVCNPGGQT